MFVPTYVPEKAEIPLHLVPFTYLPMQATRISDLTASDPETLLMHASSLLCHTPSSLTHHPLTSISLDARPRCRPWPRAPRSRADHDNNEQADDHNVSLHESQPTSPLTLCRSTTTTTPTTTTPTTTTSTTTPTTTLCLSSLPHPLTPTQHRANHHNPGHRLLVLQQRFQRRRDISRQPGRQVRRPDRSQHVCRDAARIHKPCHAGLAQRPDGHQHPHHGRVGSRRVQRSDGG